MKKALQVLWVAESSPSTSVDELTSSFWGPFVVTPCDSLASAAGLIGEGKFDAVLLDLSSEGASKLASWGALSHSVTVSAVVVRAPECPPATVLALMQRAVQDVVSSDSSGPGGLARSLRLAIERQRLERMARGHYAMDLDTGLPHRGQLIEHVNHLLALREREPAPMSLLVLRLVGLESLTERLGHEGLNVLRRRLAVRLRAGLRASDVVASLGSEGYGVLLASTDKSGDAQGVANKLLQVLRKPLSVGGQSCPVQVHVGVCRYPEQAQDAQTMLRLALEAAQGPQAQDGPFGRPLSAANDGPADA